jgi:hypothetical protein
MDRKAATRAYKEQKPTMGVYRLRNTANGRFLFGSSLNVPAMFNRLKTQLRLGVHQNAALQDDWRVLGADVFEFETLDTLEPSDAPTARPADDLRVLEEMWVERLSAEMELSYQPRPRR